jgi:hypothetical protein
VVDAAGGRRRLLASPGLRPSWSHDSKWIYFTRESGERGIWRVPVAGGIYYIPVPDQKTPYAFEVRFLDLATGRIETLNRFEARAALGLSVSRDRKPFCLRWFRFRPVPISC